MNIFFFQKIPLPIYTQQTPCEGWVITRKRVWIEGGNESNKELISLIFGITNVSPMK